MSSLVLTGDTSGSGTITVPAVAGTFTATIGSATGTHYPFTAGTAVSASSTSVDFTSIPSWVKRITVMFNAVSTNGTSLLLAQLGTSGGIQNTGYVSYVAYAGSGNTAGATSSTAGYILAAGSGGAGNVQYGSLVLTLADSSTGIWVASYTFGVLSGTGYSMQGGGAKTLSGTLDRVRVTTVNGTDTFDAGSINILYE